MNVARRTRQAGLVLAGVSTMTLAVSAMAQDASAPSATQATGDPAQPTVDQQAPTASAEGGLADIVVTAQRREQRLQDVPISVTAVTSAALEAKSVQNTLDLAQVVPGLSFTSTAGSTQVRMRGVGTSNFGPGVENPVAVYVDGVYIASTAGAFFNLANIERVEALKGPQGTLFGRNATGGLVQIITPDPSQTTTGMLRVGYANYDTKTVDAYISGPVTNNLAADFSAHYSGEGRGWGRNVNTGNYVNRIETDLIVRSKLKFEPTTGVSLVAALDYSYLLGSRPVTLQNAAGVQNIGTFERILTNRLDSDPSNDLPLINHGGFYDNSATADPRAEITSYGASLTASVDIGSATVKSITAYRETRFEDRFDIERVPQAVIGFEGVPKWRQFSEELQIGGKTGDLTYVIGAFYFNGTDRYDPFTVQLGPDLGAIVLSTIPGARSAIQYFDNAVRTESIAGFAQATYEFLPATNLTLGGRYTHEKKELSGTQQFSVDFGGGYIPLLPADTPYAAANVDPNLSFGNFSYRIALDHKFGRNVLAYVSYNTGFKSGGYNLTEPTNPAYDPEKLKAIEVGLKTELFNRRLRVNLAGFHYNYDNIQVNNFVLTAPFIVNAASAKIDGVEAEFDAQLFDGFLLSGGLSYADHRFTNFPNADYNAIGPRCTPTGVANPPCQGDASGNRLQGAPVFSGNIGFGYQTEVGNGNRLGLNGSLFHSSGYYGTVDNDPRNRQRPYDVVNASLYFELPSQLRVTGWAKNLFDVQYASNRYMSSQQATLQAAAPRTYGISLEQKF